MTKQLKKEREQLQEYVKLCDHYIEKLKTELSSLGTSYRKGTLSQKEYHDTVTFGLGGKSYRYYIEDYKKRRQQYKKRIKEIETSLKKKGTLISSFIILGFFFLSFFAFQQEGITGNVVFSIAESTSEKSTLFFNESTVYTWIPEKEGRLNTLAISGNYSGNDSLRIYLDLKESSKLIYATETASLFESECGNACYLHDNSQEEYDIRIELSPGEHLTLTSIDYLVSDLEEFVISPKNVTVNLTENRFIKNKFSIENSRNNNFSVAIYGEGELTDYLTLNTSLEQFSGSDSTRFVSYELDLPFDTAPGVYTEKIIVRYLPQGNFKGEAPREEHLITVRVLGNQEKFSPTSTLYIVLFLSVLVIVNILFFLIKKSKTSSKP